MRLTLWHLTAMIIVLCVYAGVVYLVVGRRVSRALDDQLRTDLSYNLARVERLEGGRFTWTPPLDPSSSLQTTEWPWIQIWNADATRLLFQNYDAEQRYVPESRQLAEAATDRVETVPGDPYPMRIISHRNRIRTPTSSFSEVVIENEPIVFQVGRSEAAMRQDMRTILLILLVGLPVAAALAGLGGYALASGSLAPIERMTERASSITADRLGDRLPVENRDDEMGRLAAVFNETLGRLEESFEQMRRFTADVSHQLRTPLTSIRSVGEVGLRGHKDEAAYRSIIGSMLEEADRLANLVDRLLTLSRAETGQTIRAADVVDLQELAEEVAQHLSVLAEEKDQTIRVESESHPQAVADRQLMRQALINLVDNAIKYTPAGGRVRIRVSGTSRDAIVDVIDTGPGVPPEARPHVFDRFFRAERSARGAGLGLSIAKGAVEANRGRLTLEDTGPDGSTFRIRMPRREEPRRRRVG
jgi:heavy metal sensor kinase